MRFKRSVFAGVLAGACALGFGVAQLSAPISGNGAASLHRDSVSQSGTSKHALLTALLTRADSTAGDPIYMQVPGVAGDSTDANHVGWIAVDSWSVGFQNPNALSSATGGNPSMSTFSALISYSQASPLLLKALATGQHLGTVTVDLVKVGAGGSELTYLTIVLTNAAIISIGDAGSGGGGSPTESIGIKASNLSATYTPQNADGSAGTPVSFCYDFAHKVTC
jgi:type VI secretion system secreted protein Hcp